MKVPNWVKITLWLVLIAFFSWLLSQRYNAIMEGTSNATDIIIFLIWIAFIAAFIFQEVDFFGVKLKKEIGTLKSEFKEQIINLRSDIQTINMKAEISPSFNIGAPSSDSELKDLEKNVKPIIEKALKEHGIEKPVTVPEELGVPDNSVFLFKVRYSIENELKRIARWLWVTSEERRSRTALQIANSLSQSGAILPDSVDIIREVLAICSSAIHGGDVSEASVKFVRDAFPVLLAYLKSIEKQPPIWLQENPQWMRNWKPRDWKSPPEEHKL